jgi:hypothetical protein
LENQVLQRCLRVFRAGNRLEREADTVAERVLRKPAAGVVAGSAVVSG